MGLSQAFMYIADLCDVTMANCTQFEETPSHLIKMAYSYQTFISTKIDDG